MIRANRILYVGGLVLGASLVLGGCASQPTEEAPAQAMSQQEKAKQAVADAEAAVEKTRSETGDWGLWKSTLGILGNAQNSLDKGDYDAAIDAAKEAQFEAEMGLKQYREEQDQYKLAAQAAMKSGDYPESEWIGTSGGGGMSGSKQVANGSLMVGPNGDKGTYTVGSGDTLWDISAADAIYGDPFAWPLIYKNNSSKIDDPDLIYPDQKFTIMWNVADEDYNDAVHHAKTRGSWRLGEAESSDLEYLEQY
ncbi:MAG TPA: LysM peptidoglycan-binding domain-containing protein [Gammaproteobacteria bacterium]|nr:LysM peptidoglycan-binding domain-containing protein [Gammaproteobacteria bacterium]